MARYGKRRRPPQPRVDDLFYDNPDAEDPTAEDPTAEDTSAGDVAGAGRGSDGDDDHEGGSSGGATPVGGATPDAAATPADDADTAEDDGAGVVARRSRRRGAAGRWTRALLVAAVAGGLTYGAGSGEVGGIDLATALDRSPTPPVATPQQAGPALITQASLGCVGPGLVGLDDPSVAETEQEVSAYAAAAPAESLEEGVSAGEAQVGTISVVATPEGAREEVAERASVATISVVGANWARVTATGPLAAGLSGSQVSLSLVEQERGLSTAACWHAQDDTWLLAGGGEPGRVERLLLINPTGNPITADVEVLGVDGPVEAAGGRGLVVGAGDRKVVLLDALAPGEERPVLHVTTTGGPVIAAVGDRWLEGTLDRGLELTTPAAAPAASLVIPAVPAPRAESADSVTLRVAVPGTEEAVVQLRALTTEGPVRVANDVTNVGAGSVTDIDLGDLPEGTHAIEVVADTPVVAAAHVERRNEEDGVAELAWIPAVAPSSELVGAPLPYPDRTSLKRELTLASLEGARVEITTVTEGGADTQTMEVPAAGSVSVPVDAEGSSIWVRTLEGSTSGALLTQHEDDLGVLIAGMPLPEAPVTRAVRTVAPWLP